jgi:hypothetical protein
VNTIQRKSIQLLLALLTALTLGISAIAGSAAAQTATTLLMGTTFLPDPMASPAYVNGATNYYIDQTTLCKVQSCTTKPVVTPEQFWPITGLTDLKIDKSIAKGTNIIDVAIKDELNANSDPIVVFGDSQSSSILTHEKRDLAGLSATDKGRLTFELLANPNRPNGGLLQRFAPFTIPIINLTGSGATPTNTGITTIDIAFQYDAVADFPRYPLNLLADLNILAGATIHSSYMTGLNSYTEAELIQAVNDPANRQTYQDTTYITIPAKHLPLVVPLLAFGKAIGLSGLTTPIVDLIEPTLKVLVELGYDRGISYGQPARFGLFPKVKVSTLVTDLHAAAKAGIDAALADIGVAPPCANRSSSSATVGGGKAPAGAARPARATKPVAASSTRSVRATGAGKPASRAGAAARGSAARSAPHSN